MEVNLYRRLLKGIKQVCTYLLSLFIGAVFLLPIFWMVSFSLRTTESAFEPTIWPTTVSLSQYRWLLAQPHVLRAFGNSLVVAGVATVISVFLSFLSAYGFSRFRSRFGTVLLLAIVGTKMFPGVLLAMSYFDILTTFGGFDSLWGLALIDAMYTMPFCVWMMTNYFNSITPAMDEAAMIDGCSRLGVLFRIVLPASAPGVVATITYSFLLSWNEYLFALTFISSNSKKLATVAMTELIGQWWTNTPQLMAFATLATLPLIAAFLLIQRYLVQGLTLGAEKA